MYSVYGCVGRGGYWYIGVWEWEGICKLLYAWEGEGISIPCVGWRGYMYCISVCGMGSV